MNTTTHPDRCAFCQDAAPWNKGTSTEWITALLKRLRQKFGRQVYWIKCDYDGSESGKAEAHADLPSMDDLIVKGWDQVYVRPGNNEGHVVIMEWVRHRSRPGDPHQIVRLLTVKTESGLEHALEIANWLTLAVYR